MSQALYRRYRPETFADVIGQEHVTEPLSQALRNDRVGHAYLFSGPRGCGKTTSARILARCLNCAEGPTPDPCGVCESCVALARGGPGHIDVIEIDAASHGGVDDARDLREKAFFGPASSRYKIYIIDEAHMVSNAGFNALLKVVEEPPAHLKFIFATTEPDKVIGTIRSRTHHYPFRLVPPGRLQDYLAQVCEQEGVEVEKGVLTLVVRAGRGSVRDSLSVLDQLMAGAGPEGVTYPLATALLGYTDATLLGDVVDAFAAGDGAAVFSVVDRVVEGGHDPRRFAEDLLEWVRGLIILDAVPDAAADVLGGQVPAEQLERMRHQATQFGSAELSRAGDIVAAALTEMRGATAPRLLLELMCARVLLPQRDDDPRNLHARLDRLERRLAVAAPAEAPSPPASVRAASAPAADSPARHAPAARPAVSAPASPPSEPSPASSPSERAPVAAAPVEPLAATRAESVGAAPRAESAGARPPADRAPAPTPPVGTNGTAEQAPPGEEPEGWGPATPATGPAATPASPAAGDAPDRSPAPEPTSTGTASGIDLGGVRGVWPSVLTRLSQLRRITWTLVSQNASVADLDDGRLVLGFSSAGLRDTFSRGAHAEYVRQALLDEIGLDVRVEAIVDPAAGGGAPRSAGPATAATPLRDSTRPGAARRGGPSGEHAGAATGGRPASAAAGAAAGAPREPFAPPAGASPVGGRGGDWPPAEEPSDEPPPDPEDGPATPVSFRRRAVAAAAAGDGRSRGPAYAPPRDDEASADDPDDDDTASGRELLARELGATVIGEFDDA